MVFYIERQEAVITEPIRQLLILGAGGMGRDTAWLTRRINHIDPTWDLLGFLDDDPDVQGKVFNGDPVIGPIEKLTEYPQAFVVCAVANTAVRRRIIERVRDLVPGVRFAVLVDPDAVLSDYVEIGEGSVICAHSVVSVNVSIGAHVLVNANSTVGHDAVLEDFVTAYPGVCISGATHIGNGAELGTGMQLLQGRTVGRETIVGAGAVVIRDLPENCTAVGCPAKPIKFRD